MYHLYDKEKCSTVPYRTLCGIKFYELKNLNWSGLMVGLVVGPKKNSGTWASSTALEISRPDTYDRVKYVTTNNDLHQNWFCKRCAKTQQFRNIVLAHELTQ